MKDSLFQQGLDLLFFGMGTVFIFLTLLVVTVSLMSYVVRRYFAEPEPAVFDVADIAPQESSGAVDATKLLIIQDAIYQHRAKHQP
ncbi:MAG: OadG family protein [Agarilytica sp.]